MTTAIPDSDTLMALRIRIGLNGLDVAKDDEINQAYAMTIAWMENYLNRILYSETGQETEEFTHINTMTISLKGYPTVSIDNIVAGSDETVPNYHLLKVNGLMMCDTPFRSHECSITYTMTDPLVGGLKMAMYMIFDQVWSQFTYVNDGTTSSGVKAISSDGARVEFDVNSSSSSGGDIDIATGLPMNVIGILNDYRRIWC